MSAITTVESIAELTGIQNPIDGQTIYVKSYYAGDNKGESMRSYNYSRRSENDSFLCINGWVLQLNTTPDAYQAGAKGNGESDDTIPLQRLFNYSCVTAWQNGTTKSQSYLRKGYKVQVLKGLYRITKPLLVGSGADIEFEANGSFFFSKDQGAVIYPDFSNPLDFAIKSANYDKNGVLCPYDKSITGTEFDDYTYSNTHNIKIKNLQIIAKNQIYGGLKFTASPQTIIENFYISNVDYGIVCSASWTSRVIGQTAHHKCGICAVATNHNLKFDGYFNRFSSTTLPLTRGENLIPVDQLASEKSCGVYLKGAQSAVSTQLTCEKNAIGFMAYFCPTSLNSFYSELNSEYSLVANASNVSVNTISGFFDNRNFKVQNNSTVTVTNYDAGNLNRFTPDVVEYQNEKNRLIVLNGFNYWSRNTIYQNYENYIYVDAIRGDDLNTGFDRNFPVKTLNHAIEIVSSVLSNGIALYNKCNIIVNGGVHTINNINLPYVELNITSGDSPATINFNTDSSFRLNNTKLEINKVLINVDKSYGWLSYGAAGLNSLILRDCTTNLKNNACILYSNTNATVHLYITNGVVNGSANECIAIIPSGSLATIEIKSNAMISSAITSRSDKGLDFDRDNSIKIFPVTLR